MTQWEYLIVNEDGKLFSNNLSYEGEKDLLAFLNKKGKEGWELVKGPSSNHVDLIFKKPKS